jgi:F-type H+-transporting ATPase subunit gamma
VSGTTESLRRKIAGAQDLESVVRSMKALAAASIGQYERAVASLDDYRRTVELALVACFRRAGPLPFALGTGSAATGVPRSNRAVIFGSDQGLVGRFNEVLFEFAVRDLDAWPGTRAKVWAVGERIHALVAGGDLAQAEMLPAPASIGAITPLVGQILVELDAAREDGRVEQVYLFYNRPKAGAEYEPFKRQLLPLDAGWQSTLATTAWPTKMLPEVIEERGPALRAFIRSYLFVLLFQACAESLASENACRLAAMQRAEKNIGEVVEELNRVFHRMRQEAIDEELFDVIAGYDALSPRETGGPALPTFRS